METDKKSSPGFLVGIIEGWRDFYRWRLSLKSTIKGKAMIFGVQFVLGIVMAQLVRELFGAPNNFIAYALTFAMAIGVGIAGPLSFFLSSLIFWLFVGTVSGLAIGVWPYLPSWWIEAHSQWVSGATIPSYIVGGGVVLVVIWVLSSIGIGKLRDNFMPLLLSSLILKIKEESDASDEQDVRKQALPSDAEAERMIRSVLDEESGSVIRPIPRRVDVVLEKKEEPPLTADALTDALVLETVTGTDELEGLASSDAILSDINSHKAAAPSATQEAPSSAPSSSSQEEPKASPASKPVDSASVTIDGQGKFRLNALLTGYEMAMNSPNFYDAIDIFVREHSALIDKLSLVELDYIKEQPGGAALHGLISGMAKSAITMTASIDRQPESMFGAIEDPVEQAIRDAVPIDADADRSGSAADHDEQILHRDAVPNADASADVPLASGAKASGAALARLLVAKITKTAPGGADSDDSDIGSDVDQPEQPTTSVTDDAEEKIDYVSLRSRFGLTAPTILGEERDAFMRASLAGLPTDGIDFDVSTDDSENNVPADDNSSGDRFGSHASAADDLDDQVAVEEGALDDTPPVDSALNEEEGDRAVTGTGEEPQDQLPAEDHPSSQDDVEALDVVEVIAEDGTVRLVLRRDVEAVTKKPETSPLEGLPDNPSDQDYYDLGLIPYNYDFGTEEADDAKDKN